MCAEGIFFNSVLCRPFIFICSSAPPAHFLLCLFCSDLLIYDGYFLLPRHILKAFWFWLTRPCAQTLSIVPPQYFLFPSFGQPLQPTPIAASFLETAFLYLACILASSKAQLLECAGWCREVSRLYRPVLILAKGLAMKKRNVLPMPAFYRFRA